jgi:hypothetical protein
MKDYLLDLAILVLLSLTRLAEVVNPLDSSDRVTYR